MPSLTAIPSATVAALDLCPEYALAAVGSADAFPALDLLLNGVPFRRVDDRLMAVLDIVLRYFALVDLPLLRQKVRGKTLLKERRSPVLFVLQDAVHGRGAPLRLPGRARYPVNGQLSRNRPDGLACHEVPVDPADDGGLIRIDHRRVVLFLSAIVAEELFVGQADLAVRKPLPLSPCHIL